MHLTTTPIPQTRLAFVNVELVPVRTRNGDPRYLCATWGGAMHLFGRDGKDTVIPYPEGTAGSYAFLPDREDGYAWALHTGGKITRIDVDQGVVDFVDEIPLRGLNWSAALTKDGLLVGTAHPGCVMVYDTVRRTPLHMFDPLSTRNNKAHQVRVAPDGWVVIPMVNPGAELIRLNPRSGEHQLMRTLDDTLYTFPRNSFAFLPDGRMAIPRADRIDTLRYPAFEDDLPLPYPEPGNTWQSFRDPGNGQLYAWSGVDRPLHRLDQQGRWELHLETFNPMHQQREMTMFTAGAGDGLLALTLFGELLEFDREGSRRHIAQLHNLGEQRISALETGCKDTVFTSTFINSSFQEIDLHTGEGHNITPCQASSGQINDLLWFDDRLWLAGYHGAEINIYRPGACGEWPQNPAPGLQLGQEQMRPIALKTDGQHLWCVSKAKYGLLNGALTRIDPKTMTHTVWRDLVPDSNPTSLVLHGGRAFVGTTIHRDQAGGPPGPGPAAVVAFDTQRESVCWTAHPDTSAATLTLIGILDNMLLVCSRDPGRSILWSLAYEDGTVRSGTPFTEATVNGEWRLFVSAGRLCLARPDGIFLYDLLGGLGPRLLSGPVSPNPEPVTRGNDLLYIRKYDVAVARDLWG